MHSLSLSGPVFVSCSRRKYYVIVIEYQLTRVDMCTQQVAVERTRAARTRALVQTTVASMT